MRLSLVNDMSHGLMTVIGDLNKGETATKKLTESFGKLSLAGKTAFSGALAFGAGAAITAAMKPALDAAQRLQDAQISASEAGIHGSDMALLKAQAFNDAQKNLGTTIAGNTKLLTELYSVTGSMPGAVSLAPHFERVQKAMEWRGQNGDGQGYAEAKALEHRGDRVFQNPAIRDAEASAIERVNFATGGKVSPKDFLAASQTGKQAYQGYSSDFLTGAYAAYMQVHSGATAGARGAMAARTLIGGHGDKKAKTFFQGLGLMGKSGNLSGDQAAAFAADPEKWINGPLRAAYMTRHKGATDDQFSRDVAANTNGSTGDFLSWFITNREKVEKDQKVFAGADTGDQAYAKGKAGKTGSHDILLQSWENLLATLGTSLLPMATKATNDLAGAINKVAQFAHDHPTLTKFAMVGTALTGVILIVAGAAAVLGAGFAVLAPIFAGVTAAGAATVAGFTVAVGGLIALGSWLHNLNWGAIWQGIKNGIMGFIGFLGDAWKHRPTWLGGDGVTPVPKVGENGATQADAAYYAALNGNKTAPAIDGGIRIAAGDGSKAAPAIAAGAKIATASNNKIAAAANNNAPATIVNKIAPMGGDSIAALGSSAIAAASKATPTSDDKNVASAMSASTIAPKAMSVTINTTNMLDGKKIGESTAKYQVAELERSIRGDSATTPDYGAGMVNPGASY